MASWVDRLTAIKSVGREFIERRVGDRIGLILFGREAYLQAPLTFDRKTVETLLDESAIGLAGKETAIGDAIGLAIRTLDDAKVDAGRRVLILLTDGANTAGSVEPLKAADLAAQRKMVIYPIGIGADSITVRSLFGLRQINPSSDLDEATLTAIADKTGGRYFRARDADELTKIYEVARSARARGVRRARLQAGHGAVLLAARRGSRCSRSRRAMGSLAAGWWRARAPAVVLRSEVEPWLTSTSCGPGGSPCCRSAIWLIWQLLRGRADGGGWRIARRRAAARARARRARGAARKPLAAGCAARVRRARGRRARGPRVGAAARARVSLGRGARRRARSVALDGRGRRRAVATRTRALEGARFARAAHGRADRARRVLDSRVHGHAAHDGHADDQLARRRGQHVDHADARQLARRPVSARRRRCCARRACARATSSRSPMPTSPPPTSSSPASCAARASGSACSPIGTEQGAPIPRARRRLRDRQPGRRSSCRSSTSRGSSVSRPRAAAGSRGSRPTTAISRRCFRPRRCPARRRSRRRASGRRPTSGATAAAGSRSRCCRSSRFPSGAAGSRCGS